MRIQTAAGRARRADRSGSAVLALMAIVLSISLLASAAAALAAEDKDRGWLGVTLQDVTSAMARALDLDRAEGALVGSVQEDSPADEAGLEEGDVIVGFAGNEVDDASDLVALVRATEPGDEVEIEVLRDGHRRTLEVEIGERPDREFRVLRLGKKPGDENDEDVWSVVPPEGGDMRWFQRGVLGGGYLGVKLQPLGEQLGRFFGVEDGKGALVQEVVEDGPAAEAGLQAGDVIVGIDDEEVDDPGDVTMQIIHGEPGQRVELHVVRDRGERTVEVTLGERKGMGEWDLGQLPGLERLPHARVAPMPRMRYERQERDEGRQQQRQEMQQLRDQLRDLRRELRDLRRELRREAPGSEG